MLELWVDGKEIEHISTAVGMVAENTALEAVFPDKEYWNIDQPKSFDFVANEGKTKKIMQDYLEKMKNYEGKPFYVTANIETRNDVHWASSVEINDLAVGLVKEFFRVYNVAMT